jgi:hypothetical protein
MKTMTFLETLWAILVFCFMLFMPGFTFIRAIFPRKGELGGDYDNLYQFILSIVVSVLILVMVGFMLDVLSDVAGEGLVRRNYILGTLAVLCGLFFLTGWWRGSYPFMGKLHPALKRHHQPLILGIVTARKRQAVLAKMDRLTEEIVKVRHDIADCERKISLTKGAERIHYSEKRKVLNQRLIELSNNFRDLEEVHGT